MDIIKGVKKSGKKKSQYIIGSIVAIVILFFWVTLPLIQNSSSSSSSSFDRNFSKKTGDIALLADSAGVDAPGNNLSGELIDNPATSLDMAASSLFSSGETESENTQTPQVSEVKNVPSNDSSYANVGSNYGSVPKGKLSVLPSLASGNSGSNTIGTSHNKFFGGEANGKADFVKPNELDTKTKDGKTSQVLASLKNAQDQSLKALNSKDLNQAKNSASSAFENNVKKEDKSKLETDVEKKMAESGLQMGKVDQDFKRNDPNLDKKSVKLPEPKTETDNGEEEMKQMIRQMIMQATIGKLFGAVGDAMAASIFPENNKNSNNNHKR